MAFLGIDAGASATKWAVLDGETVLASGRQPAMDAHLYREESVVRLREVIRGISGSTTKFRIDGIVMGITGYSEDSDFQRFFAEEFAAPLSVMSDIELAYKANFQEGEGVLIYAGTGAVAFTTDSSGRGVRVGGWGYLLGDEGAGYWMGREAIRASMLLIDGKRTPKRKSLEERTLAAINASDWSGVKSFVYGNDRNAVAALSKVVAESASDGDETAINIVKSAAQHLAELVRRSEEITVKKNLDVKFTGGISSIKLIADEMVALLGNRCSVSTVDIATAAAQLAAKSH